MERLIKLMGIFAGLAAFSILGTLFFIDGGLTSFHDSKSGGAQYVRTVSTTTNKSVNTSVVETQVSTTTTEKQTQAIIPQKSVPKPRLATIRISTPTPLLVDKPTTTQPTIISSPVATTTTLSLPSSTGALNQNAILQITNQERAKVGLPALSFNAALASMAEAKSNDMIAKQYFAHVAPDGTDVVKLSERFGYAYLNIGENLALGDFVSSTDVMNGWMNSPGHRANILNKNYTEIGIAAVMGNYQGRQVWYAVQEFGRPASLCQAPDQQLAQKITTDESGVTALEKTLKTLRDEMAAPNISTDDYNAKVRDYNALIDPFNQLVSVTKSDIETYNTEVNTFNSCVGT